MVTSDAKRMGEFVNALWVKIVGYAICMIIGGLNVYLLIDNSLSMDFGTPSKLHFAKQVAAALGFVAAMVVLRLRRHSRQA